MGVYFREKELRWDKELQFVRGIFQKGEQELRG